MRSLLFRLFRATAAIALTLGLTPLPSDAQTLYGITFEDKLITINTSTAAGTLVGSLDSSMLGLGLGERSGSLYTFDQVADRIRQLDPATAGTLATIDIGLGLVGEGGLDFRADGIGYLSTSGGGTGQLFSFDITGPSSMAITAPGGLIPSMDGLAFSSGGVLYGVSQGTAVSPALYTIDQTTGATLLIGSLGLGTSRLGGLDFAPDGTLFAAFSGGTSSPSSLYTVNPATGAATLVGDIGFNDISGLAFVGGTPTPVVPEPCSFVLLASACVTGAGSVLRRRRA